MRMIYIKSYHNKLALGIEMALPLKVLKEFVAIPFQFP